MLSPAFNNVLFNNKSDRPSEEGTFIDVSAAAVSFPRAN
jgi:hypothetical protein